MRIFLDTSPLIYLIEKHPHYAFKIRDYLIERLLENHELLTSVLTIAEFEVKPRQIGRLDLIDEFEGFLERTRVSKLPITLATAKISAKLRAKYPPLKGMDSLQLASAIEHDCSIFLTNDKRLGKMDEIGIQLIDGL